MLVRVRGGYSVEYRGKIYDSKEEVDLPEDFLSARSHLFDKVVPPKRKEELPEPPKEELPVQEEPVVKEEAMDTQRHRAIVKPTRSRSGKK